jgi:hypothetical protein
MWPAPGTVDRPGVEGGRSTPLPPAGGTADQRVPVGSGGGQVGHHLASTFGGPLTGRPVGLVVGHAATPG